MKKVAFFTISLIFTCMVLADANIDKVGKSRNYLLTAPGTITGTVNKADRIQPQRPKVPLNSYIQPQQQQFIQDNYNFPQYGRLRAQPNPWLDQPATRQRSQMPSSGSRQIFNNPWDINNLPSLAPNGYQNKPGPGDSMRDPAYGFYGDDYGNSSFYPKFTTPLDQNFRGPPSAAGFPNMNGLMPGLGKDDGSFPFMPFGMF
jgi:hypothetical protein